MNGILEIVNKKYGLGLEKYEEEIATASLIASIVFLGLSTYRYIKLLG